MMDILKIIFLIIVLGINGFLFLSISLGCRGIKDKTSKMGLSVLKVCLITDILLIIGGVVLW